jgi:hypothetical protein
MVKITVFREDNQPVLHLLRRQSASASHFEKTIAPVLKKTILLEKTILPFPAEISLIFCSYFGQCDDLINSFRDLMTFSKTLLNRLSLGGLTKMEGTQMEMFNFLGPLPTFNSH